MTSALLALRALTKLDELKRTGRPDRDDCVYAGCHCPVMVRDAVGQLVMRPMRYHYRDLAPRFSGKGGGTCDPVRTW